MDTERDAVVAGLFESQRQAEAAVARLHRVGVTDSDLEIGEPEPGRYRIERHESAEVWTGVRNGMIVGAIVGSLVSMGIMTFVVPGLTPVGLIELSVPMGAFWGLFMGGLTGMALKSVHLSEGEPRCTITDESSDVLVVVHAGDRYWAVHEAMKRAHPRYLLIDVPAVRHDRSRLVSTA